MVKVVRSVVYCKDGKQHKIYKTRRAPTRYYYMGVGNKRVYIDTKLITTDLDQYITN